MKNKLTVLAILVLFITGMSFAQVTTPTVTAPLHNAVGVSIVPTFSWSSGGTYVIEVSTSATSWIAPDLVYTSTVAVASGHTIPEASKLSNGVTYYWRAVAGAGTGTFTTVLSAMPYLSYPSNGAILSGTTTIFSWNTGVAGLKYYLQIALDAAFTLSVPGIGSVDAANTTNTYYSFNNNVFANGTPYYWRVIAKNIAGTVVYNFSNTWQFSTPGLPTPYASYPTGNVSIYNNPPSLYWYLDSYVPQVTEFDVRYSSTSAIACQAVVSGNAVDATDGYFSTSSTSWFTTIPFALTPGATYYWQVASKAGTSVSTFSTVSSFSVYGSSTFLICYPSYPTSGTTVASQPTFYWYANAYAPILYYQLQISTGTGAGFAGGIIGALTKTNLTSNSYTYTAGESANFVAGTTYYWRVSGGYASGVFGPFSAEGNFVYPTSSSSTVSVATPYPVAPTAGSVVNVTNPTLSWYAYSTEPLQFRVTWATNPALNGGTGTFVTAVGTSGWINSTSFILGGLTAGATYYWQAQSRLATTPASTSAWSTVAWFTTAAGSASVVPLAGSPINGTPINNTNATLSWILPTKSTSSLKYEVQYSKKADFSDAVSVRDLDKPNVEVKNLDKDAVYYWRASSTTNSGITSSYSAPTSFSTGATVTAIGNREQVPTQFELSQNYPNPFNPSTVISYQLPTSSFVTLKVYDMLGREVKTLVSKETAAGKYSVDWNGDDSYGNKVATGAYVYRLTAGDFISVKKMLLIK